MGVDFLEAHVSCEFYQRGPHLFLNCWAMRQVELVLFEAAQRAGVVVRVVPTWCQVQVAMHQFEPRNLVAWGCKERFDLPYFGPGDVDLQTVLPGLFGTGRGFENALREVVRDLFYREFIQGHRLAVYFPAFCLRKRGEGGASYSSIVIT